MCSSDLGTIRPKANADELFWGDFRRFHTKGNHRIRDGTKETNKLDLRKLEVLVRELSDLHNQGKDVVLVTSGAVAVGASALGFHGKPAELKQKQACSAVGQAKLMMIYQKLFAEYNQVAAQILMTKNTIVDNLNRYNAHNTFTQLLKMGAIPVVNENDTVATYEIEIGDNDTRSEEHTSELQSHA